jgi:hypothetical protein
MVESINDNAEKKLESAQNIWIGTVRPDGRPHFVPVWYVWSLGKIFICIDYGSVKARNIEGNSQVVLALEDGSSPVICEGRASKAVKPFPDEVVRLFQQKYDWDIRQDTQYQMLVEVTPEKWLVW